MYNNVGAIFPPQKIPVSQKDNVWKRKSVDALINRHKRGDERHYRMKTNYNILNSDFDMKDLKYVVDPFDVKEGFPAKMQNINAIRPKIEGLKGEFIKRPRNFIIFQTDEKAVRRVLDKEKEYLSAAFETSLSMTTDKEATDYLKQRLQEIRSYIKNKYYSPEEQTANSTIKYLREVLDLDLTFLKMWEDALVAGEAIAYSGIINGEPTLERVNPLTFSYDRDPELRFIEDGEWAVREMLMTLSDVHDRFSDILDENDFNLLIEKVTQGHSGQSNLNGASDNFQYTTWQNMNNINSYDWVEDNRKATYISVYHCVWKSFKKVGYLTYLNESGEVITTIVDETYKLVEGETIEWDWILELWEGYRFWKDVYSEIKPVEYQYTSLDQPNAKKLPFNGASFNTNNTDGKSLVELMKPLQYFYMILFYRLELALARDAGKPIVMDITQIPKSQGLDPDKWLHYLKSLGVVFINPYETGWDIPGREGGKPAAYNQITAVDMTMQNVVGEYLNLMGKIEDMLDDISGVNQSRQGNTNASELVGKVKQDIVQSSHKTEPLFYMMDKVIRNSVTSLLNTAKYAWRNSNKKYINYVLSGPERIFIQIDDAFIYSEHDIFVSDSSREDIALQTIREMAQPAMQNGATLLDIASILSENNVNSIKQKLSEIEQQRANQIQQAQQNEQQVLAEEHALKQRELDIKEADSIRKAEVDLQIASMKTVSGAVDLDMAKLNLQKEKQKADEKLRQDQLQEVERHNKVTESISRVQKRTINTKK